MEKRIDNEHFVRGARHPAKRRKSLRYGRLSAAGPDQWRPNKVVATGHLVHNWIAEICNVAETGEGGPEDLRTAKSACILKQSEPNTSDLLEHRVMTVLKAIHRAWSAMRRRHGAGWATWQDVMTCYRANLCTKCFRNQVRVSESRQLGNVTWRRSHTTVMGEAEGEPHAKCRLQGDSRAGRVADSVGKGDQADVWRTEIFADDKSVRVSQGRGS